MKFIEEILVQYIKIWLFDFWYSSTRISPLHFQEIWFCHLFCFFVHIDIMILLVWILLLCHSLVLVYQGQHLAFFCEINLDNVCQVLDNVALDDMGNRIDELEQSINDLRVEMGQEGSPSPSAALKSKDDSKAADDSA